MYQIRKRALSIVLLVAMILTLMPVSAAAAAVENGTAQTPPHILSTIKHEVDGDGKETGQITAQIEAYLTDSTNKTRTVKPCDIIFLIEQSAFMNTQNNTAFYGQERKDILDTMEKMLDAIPKPTTGSEHRWRFRVMDASIIPAIRIPMSQINIREKSWILPRTRV